MQRERNEITKRSLPGCARKPKQNANNYSAKHSMFFFFFNFRRSDHYNINNNKTHSSFSSCGAARCPQSIRKKCERKMLQADGFERNTKNLYIYIYTHFIHINVFVCVCECVNNYPQTQRLHMNAHNT